MNIEARTAAEKARYDELYAKRGYPKGNPERLCVWAGCEPQLPVLDLGCGRASLASIFSHYTGVDFTLAGIPANMPRHARFFCAPLAGQDCFITREEIKRSVYHAVVCADVMEHIPPEDVDEVLNNIFSVSAERFLFSISCVESRWKDEKGGLHLTVQEPRWWWQKLVARSGVAGKRCVAYGKTLYAELTTL